MSPTWSDNHRVHTAEYYHCALLICEPEDYPVLKLDNHTDYKDFIKHKKFGKGRVQSKKVKTPKYCLAGGTPTKIEKKSLGF